MTAHLNVTAPRLVQRSLASLCCAIAAPLLMNSAGPSQTLASTIEPPPGQGMPKSTVGGGSRTGRHHCRHQAQSLKQLMALSPKQQLRLTTGDRSGLLIDLPMTAAPTLELSFFDHAHNGISQSSLPVPLTAGLVSI